MGGMIQIDINTVEVVTRRLHLAAGGIFICAVYALWYLFMWIYHKYYKKQWSFYDFLSYYPGFAFWFIVNIIISVFTAVFNVYLLYNEVLYQMLLNAG
jgi:hypothetical protein